MMNSKIIAMILVVVIGVAGCAGAVYVLNSDDSEKGPSGFNTDASVHSVTSGLPVYGNANEDNVIDATDISIIKDVINGNKLLSDYPYADADHNGVVDRYDIDLVEKIIAGESCEVCHINTCSTGDYVASTMWPIKSAISTGSANMLMLLTLSGVKDMVHGISYSSSSKPDSTLFPTFSAMKSLGSSSTKITTDAAGDTLKKYNVTALISDKTASTISNEPEFEELGVDVVRVDAAYVDVDKYCTQMLLIGFLFGNEDKSLAVAEWEKKMMADIATKISENVTDKVSAITTNGSTPSKGAWVSAGTSDYLDVIKAAGGKYAIDDNNFPSTYSSGAYFFTGDTWLYNYSFDYIVSIRTSGWYSGLDQSQITSKYDDTMEFLKSTQAYINHKAYVITGDAPIIIRIAYAASVMYPTLFTEEWANNLNKEFFGNFYDVEVDFTDKVFVISYDTAHPTA